MSRPDDEPLPAATIPVLIGLGLLVFFLAHYLVAGFAYPIGPDAPVYLWWSRLAASSGLSSAMRPGIPAITLALSGASGAPITQILGGLGGALGAAAGLAGGAVTAQAATAAGLVRTARHTAIAFAVGAVLCGTFAVNLAGGYFANLAFALLFLGACSLLALESRPGAWGAAGLLAAGGLAHPLFWPVGIAILVLAGLMGWMRRTADERPAGEPGRLLVAIGGGGLVAGAGLLAMLPVAAPPGVGTSQDAYLRRSGLDAALRAEFLERFWLHLLRYLPFVTVPLAVWGSVRSQAFLARVLRSWLWLAALGIAIGLVTGWVPPERFMNFAYVLPIGVTLGLAKLIARSEDRRALAIAGSIVVIVAMVAYAGFTWGQNHPYIDDASARKATSAAWLAKSLQDGTQLVFAADAPDAGAAFAAARDANVLRSAMPADRIANVTMYIGDLQDLVARRVSVGDGPVHEQLSSDSLNDVNTEGPVVVVATEREATEAGMNQADGVETITPIDLYEPGEPLAPSPPWTMVTAGVLTFFLMGGLGYGWALVVTDRCRLAVMLAPAFGVAASMLAAVALERVGLALDSRSGGGLTLLVAGGVGYVVLFLTRQRRARTESAP